MTERSAIRSRGRRGSTVVPNWRWEDPGLDPYDRCIAGWLASHADSYVERFVSRNEIARRTGISGPKVSTSVRKLEELGIVTVEESPQSKGGGTRWTITFDFDVWEAPPAGSHAPGLLGATLPVAGSHAPGSIEHQGGEQPGVVPPSPPEVLTLVPAPASPPAALSPRPEDDPEFLMFWTMYGKVGPRSKAWECWRKARRVATADAILEGLERWVEYWQQPGAAAVKWPQGWLNERRWEDDPPEVLLRVQRPAARTGRASALERMRDIARGGGGRG